MTELNEEMLDIIEFIEYEAMNIGIKMTWNNEENLFHVITPVSTFQITFFELMDKGLFEWFIQNNLLMSTVK